MNAIAGGGGGSGFIRPSANVSASEPEKGVATTPMSDFEKEDAANTEIPATTNEDCIETGSSTLHMHTQNSSNYHLIQS